MNPDPPVTRTRNAFLLPCAACSYLLLHQPHTLPREAAYSRIRLYASALRTSTRMDEWRGTRVWLAPYLLRGHTPGHAHGRAHYGVHLGAPAAPRHAAWHASRGLI